MGVTVNKSVFDSFLHLSFVLANLYLLCVEVATEVEITFPKNDSRWPPYMGKGCRILLV